MFELYIQAFHSYKIILSISLSWSFSDPEVAKLVVVLHDVEHVIGSGSFHNPHFFKSVDYLGVVFTVVVLSWFMKPLQNQDDDQLRLILRMIL